MSNQNVATPWAFVHEVERLFNIKFKYDMAADESNAKASCIFTEEEDSLSRDWPTDGWCWLNPPFVNLTKWIDKVLEQNRRGVKIMSVWPLSGDLNQINVWKQSNVNIVHGRLWPQVRGLMLCEWANIRNPSISGLRWNGKDLTREW